MCLKIDILGKVKKEQGIATYSFGKGFIPEFIKTPEKTLRQNRNQQEIKQKT